MFRIFSLWNFSSAMACFPIVRHLGGCAYVPSAKLLNCATNLSILQLNFDFGTFFWQNLCHNLPQPINIWKCTAFRPQADFAHATADIPKTSCWNWIRSKKNMNFERNFGFFNVFFGKMIKNRNNYPKILFRFFFSTPAIADTRPREDGSWMET